MDCPTEEVYQARSLGACVGKGNGEVVANCPAVLNERLVVPNYFLRVFTSTSHMPFCPKNTKQLEVGLQIL